MLFVLAAIFLAIIYRWISLERLQRFSPAITTPSPSPEPTPSRPPVITGRQLDTAKLFNGVTVNSTVETPPGADATTERVDPQSYLLELKLRARLPSPNKTIDELAKVNPQLPTILPGLSAMVTAESVSPLFIELYERKIKGLREDLGRLDQLLSRHNFYDCQTVLQLEHPQSHRKALLVQADMDVDADGSDSDRMPTGPAVTTNFQPFTSYRWKKATPTPNPYLPAIEERIKRLETEAELKTTTPERKRELRATVTQLRSEVITLKKFSFLIGATDPFIVIPSSFARGGGGKLGDYALVISGDRIFPALVGDIGPNDKAGEASLRIAKEINTVATAYSRPVSDLKVTYLIFPGTADTPFGPPDLEKIYARCQALTDEIGGATVPLHRWENIIPPPPTPTPTPTATPTASPSPTLSPSPSATTIPPASPAPTFAFPLPSATPSP